jgi:hypothetical protein
LPNNRFSRHAVSFRQTCLPLDNKRLQVEVSASYIHQTVENKISGGTVYNPLYNLYLAPRNLDMDYYRNFESEGAWLSENIYVLKAVAGKVDSEAKQVTLKGMKQNWFLGRGSSGENNPFWLSNRSLTSSTTRQFWGSAELKYRLLDGLNAQARIKYDRTEVADTDKKYATTVEREGTLIDRGQSDYATSTRYNLFADFILNYSKTAGDFSIAANLGASFDIRKGEDFWMRSGGPGSLPYYTDVIDIPLTVNHLYPDASSIAEHSFYRDSDWDKALFVTGTLGYRDMAFLDATYRIDWTRTYTQFKAMASVKPYFDYYSVGANVLLNRLFDGDGKIDLLKPRISYSVVGNPLPNKRITNGMQVQQLGGGILAVDVSEFVPEPEMTRSLEAGADFAFFRNTVDFNFTLYNALSINQYLEIKSALGQIKPINTGKIRNRGIEVMLGYNWMPSKSFLWKTGFNFAFNDNKIIRIHKNRKDVRVTIGTSDNLQVKFLEGGSYGDLYAKDFSRYNKFDEELGLGKEGDIILDQQGMPSLASRGGHNRYLGNMNSNIHTGWHNTFKYRDISLYFLIDGKIGGKVVSFSEAWFDARGVSERSAQARTSGLVWTDANGEKFPAVIMPDGNPAAARKYYETIGSQIFPSEYVYDATSFRMREVSLGYTFSSLPAFIRSLTVSLTGRNLFFLYRNAPVDPDVSQSTANALGGVDIFTLPTTRSYGLNIKLSF